MRKLRSRALVIHNRSMICLCCAAPRLESLRFVQPAWVAERRAASLLAQNRRLAFQLRVPGSYCCDVTNLLQHADRRAVGCGVAQTVEPKQLTANAQLVSETQQKKSLQAPPNIIEEESDAKLQDPSSRHSAGSTRRDGTESLGGSNNIDNGGGEYKTEGPRRRSQNSVISEGGNDSMRS